VIATFDSRLAVTQRLSIIIPTTRDDQALESGLVSVLEHRPAASEVLVVLNRAYADPYELKDEVRFVQAPRGAGLFECLNVGALHAQGEVFHFLGCGLEARPHWAEAALAHFADPQVGAVVPSLVELDDANCVLAQGLEYDPAGRASLHLPEPRSRSSRSLLAGPLAVAGFYRAAAIGPGFNPNLGLQLAEVDLALRLEHEGFRIAVEPDSRIGVEPSLLESPLPSFRQGREAESLYWRYRQSLARQASLASHMATVIAEAMGSFPRWRSPAQLAGRLVGACQGILQRRVAA